MKIPLGNFGNALPQQQNPRAVGDTGAGQVAQAVQNLAATQHQIAANEQASAAQEAARMQAKQDALVAQDKAALQRVQSLEKMNAAELAADEIGGKINEQVRLGAIDAPVASQQLTASWGEFKKTQLANVQDPEHARLLNAQMDQYSARQQMRFNESASAATMDKQKGTVGAAFNNLLQLSIKDVQGARQKFGDILSASTLPADQKVQLAQKFVTESDGAIVKHRINNAGDDVATLQQVQADLRDPKKFGGLQPDTRETYWASVQGKIVQLNNARSVEIGRREALASKAIDEMQQQEKTGFPPKPEDIERWGSAVKGTPQETAYSEGVRRLSEVQRVRALTPDKQMEWADAQEAKMRSGGANPQEVAVYNGVRAAYESQAKDLKTDPYAFAKKNAGIDTPDIQWADFNTPDGRQRIQGQFAERAQLLGAISRQFQSGNVPLKPLKPTELTSLQGLIQSGDITMQAGVYSMLAQSIGDPRMYMNAMQQLAPDMPVRARVGQIMAMKKMTTGETHMFGPDEQIATGDVAKTLLLGASIVEKSGDAKKQDGSGRGFELPEEKLRKKFNSELDPRLYQGRPNDRERDYQVFRAYYAGLVAQGKVDSTSNIGDDLAGQIKRAVIGGVSAYHKVVMPIGMNDADFTDRVSEKMAQIGRTMNRNTKLILAKDGQYFVDNGGRLASDSTGRPVILDMTK